MCLHEEKGKRLGSLDDKKVNEDFENDHAETRRLVLTSKPAEWRQLFNAANAKEIRFNVKAGGPNE